MLQRIQYIVMKKEIKNRSIHIRLTEREHSEIIKIANKYKVRKSDVVRMAVNKFVEVMNND